MTNSLALQRLARVLDVPVDRLGYLTDVPPADLDSFRRRICDHLFEIAAPRLRQAAAAARIIPPQMVAKMVAHNAAPLMTAYLATVLDPDRATAVATRLPPQYLAQVASLLDLDRTAPVIRGLPERIMVSVAENLSAQQDWLTLSGAMTIVSDSALSACLAALDEEAILAIAHLMDNSSRDRAAAMLPEPLAALVRAAGA
ncbi:hypothetical protein [Nocardia sp. BMG51109]|uniref:hypothetical protein n=1 Tax=Nocardia sp. BMG51109 TaxID=1056816 RepID=UPI0004BBC669|nr:hypothetical protein [Nocardia sp. BMG51109]